MAKGLRPKRSLRQAMQHEISMYCIAQKEGRGFDKAIEICKDRMSRYGVTPNILIVPPSMLLYLSLAPEEKIRFMEGGERAVANFEAGKAGLEARGFRGLGVFTSMPFEVSDDQDSVQMLQRSSQVGEFYRMAPPPVFPKDKPLPPNYMDLLIYDEEGDRLVHIEFEQALYASCAGQTTGGVNLDVGTLITGETETTKQNDALTQILNAANDHYKAATKGSDGLKKAGATGDLTASDLKNVNELVNIVKQGVYLRVCIVLARPFIEHHMLSAVAAVSGRDTGATLYGPADMQISANTSVKTIEGHFTCYTKSVITKPQNVFILRDVMCNGYVAGGNTKFFGHDGKMLTQAMNPELVRRAIQDRLSMTDDLDADYGSMLAFLCPYTEVEVGARDQVISITERLLPWEVTKGSGSTKTDGGFPGGKVCFDLYKKAFALDQIHFGEDVRAAENMEFVANGSMNNGMCIIGPHRRYSPYSTSFFDLTPGQGHFGPDAIPGDARWRRGETVSLESARNSMVGLEVAAQSQLVMSRREFPIK